MPDCNLLSVGPDCGCPRRLPLSVTKKEKTTKTTMKKTTMKRSGQQSPGDWPVESYLAPIPPKKGRIIGLDCHPDIYTAAVF